MRLLQRTKTGEIRLTQDLVGDDPIPPYAILSHTWGLATEEVTIEDITNGTAKDKSGYEKICFCGEQARKDNLHYFWVDTCCIDKSNSAELSEAINSMFQWYQNATKCYVYMSDVSTDQAGAQHSQPLWEANFRVSRWFRRGWTLQELIAPPLVEFFCSNGCYLGNKEGLVQQIHDVTGIPDPVLRGATLSDFDVNERMMWAQGRETKRPEDRAYSMLGILGICIPLIYGEGIINAFDRLERELEWQTNKQKSSFSRNLILNPHPVKRNYRKVIVVIISWECDRLEMTVQDITKVFREIYHYEVREVRLSLQNYHNDNPHWPWPDNSEVQQEDLQIVHYLGSTRRVSGARDFMDIRASPFQSLSHSDDNISNHRNWLQSVIGIPNLVSDVLIILDCYVEGLAGASSEKSVSFLFDDSIPWARQIFRPFYVDIARFGTYQAACKLLFGDEEIPGATALVSE